MYLAMSLSLGCVILVRIAGGNPTLSQLIGKELAFGLATGFCLKIAGEYAPKTALRTSWFLLAAFAAVSAIRHLAELPEFEPVPNIHIYRHLAILVSLLCLLAGMSSMARAFLHAGLGFTIYRIDVVGVAFIFGLLSTILVMNQHLSEAHFPLVTSRYLQLAGQVAIAAAAAVSVILHRLSVEMGGGRLAVAMRFIVAHIVSRVLLVLYAILVDSLHLTHPAARVAGELLFDITPWIFALGGCYRAQMISVARNQSFSRPQRIMTADIVDA
jgi:hypothetical protein